MANASIVEWNLLFVWGLSRQSDGRPTAGHSNSRDDRQDRADREVVLPVVVRHSKRSFRHAHRRVQICLEQEMGELQTRTPSAVPDDL